VKCKQSSLCVAASGAASHRQPCQTDTTQRLGPAAVDTQRDLKTLRLRDKSSHPASWRRPSASTPAAADAGVLHGTVRRGTLQHAPLLARSSCLFGLPAFAPPAGGVTPIPVGHLQRWQCQSPAWLKRAWWPLLRHAAHPLSTRVAMSDPLAAAHVHR